MGFVAPGGQAHGLGLAGALPQGAHGAGVAELRAALGVETDASESRGVLSVGIESEALAAGAPEEDRHELVGRVILEQDGAGEAGAQTGIGVEEAAHLAGIAGDNDAEPVAVVLHQLEQGVDRLAAEVGAVMGGSEAVGLVDEEDAVEGCLDGLAGLDGGLADEAGDEQGTVDFEDMAGAQKAEADENLAHETGGGGLAGSGIAKEDVMEAWAFGPDAVAATLAFGLEDGDELQDLGFDRGPADHAVHLGEDGLERTNGPAHRGPGSGARGGRGRSGLRRRRAALNGAGEPPAHDGEAEEEQADGRESRRDG